MFKTMKKNMKKILIILGGMVGLATLSFNCAPNMFESARFLSNQSSSSSDIYDTTNSPYALMTSIQYYQSILNVTDQAGSALAANRNEFSLRTGAMSGNYSLSSINGPLLIASTSLAGQVCSSLLSTEKAEAAAARTFFGPVDFTQKIANQDPNAYLSVAGAMSQSFYGRDLDQDEASILGDYYQEFVGNLSASDANSSTQTSNLYLSLCAAMLSSFDAMTN